VDAAEDREIQNEEKAGREPDRCSALLHLKSAQPAASSYCELAASHSSSARCSALAAPAAPCWSWAACLGSRVNRSGSASAVSIFEICRLMRAISASASANLLRSGTRFSLRLR